MNKTIAMEKKNFYCAPLTRAVCMDTESVLCSSPMEITPPFEDYDLNVFDIL